MRTGVEQHLRALRRLPGQNRVLAYNATRGAPSWLRQFKPDAVILHTTFLGLRWIEGFERRRGDRNGSGSCAVRKSRCRRTTTTTRRCSTSGSTSSGSTSCSHLSRSTPARSFPYRATGGHHEGLTGYVDDTIVRTGRRPSRLESRHLTSSIARPTPLLVRQPRPVEARIGQVAADSASRLGLRTDISTRPDDAILGDRWLEFLASGRAVVGGESGSSVVDPTSGKEAGARPTAARARLDLRRGDARMPSGWDAYRFVALSPRHLEAALTGTAQLLVEGGYNGVLEPGRHFLPVKADFSDLEAALAETRDPRRLQRLADAAYEEICLSGRYSYERLVERSTTACACSAPASDDVGRSWLGSPRDCEGRGGIDPPKRRRRKQRAERKSSGTAASSRRTSILAAMCGIAGAGFARPRACPALGPRARRDERPASRIAARTAQATGSTSDQHVGFAHRRLSDHRPRRPATSR